MSDLESIAVRLVNCLPRRGSQSAKSAQDRSTGDQKQKSGATNWLVWLALGAAVLFAMSRLDGDKVSEPDVSNVWSNQQHLAGVASIDVVQPDFREGSSWPSASALTLEPLSSNVV